MRDHLDFLRAPVGSTAPYHRALVFLDSRDLINCFEKGNPVGVRELRATFRRANARLIVTFTTICELFPGADLPTPDDIDRGVELARSLDSVPHGFIRSSTIVAREFREAYRAWEGNAIHSVRRIDPFVDRFYKTTWKPAPGTTDLLLEDEGTRLLDRTPVWDQVRMLAAYPESLRWDKSYTLRVIGSLTEDRAVFGAKRGTKVAREAAVKRHLIAGGLEESRDGVSAFARWLHQNPDICPGWRLGWDAWEEYRSNLGAPVDPGDLRDFSHIAVLPYVTHFTTDAKWRDVLCGRAWKRRVSDNLPAPLLRSNLLRFGGRPRVAYLTIVERLAVSRTDGSRRCSKHWDCLWCPGRAAATTR